RPVLSAKCYACHSSRLAAPKGELVLDTKAGVLKGGKLGPVIVPGNPAESRLLEALTYSNAHLQMPPSGKLADSVIADFEQWIAAVIGLKPTYEEVEAYANDPSPAKYETLVARLLASPQYGERWARYWLDVVRYGEDNPGNITNPPYPHAWRYRDWVIESLNKD